MPGRLAQCEADLEACLAEPCAIFPGDGQTGAPLSYTDHGDGTFTDDKTGLMWEVKTGTVGDPVECSHVQFPPACIDVSDVNNRWTWTDASDGDDTNPDGTAFEFFLPMLNQTCGGESWGLGCESDADCASASISYCGLGGHMDWRLPTAKELQSLVDYSVNSPAVHEDLPGATAPSSYWSSTSYADYEYLAWRVSFYRGYLYDGFKYNDYHVRAVRGGW